jgi:hypothetical protein
VIPGIQPESFRAVILGFFLTLFVAGGTGSALALWSQSAATTMQVKADTLPSPDLQCSDVPNETAVLVTWVPQRSGVTGYDAPCPGRTNNQDRELLGRSNLGKDDTLTIGVRRILLRCRGHCKIWFVAAQPANWSTIHANIPLVGL